MYERLNGMSGGLLDRMMRNNFFKYVVFIFGGGMGFLLLISITFMLTKFVGIWRVYSYAVGLTCAFAFTFIYHRYITFNNKTFWKERFFRYAIAGISIELANLSLFYVLTEFMPRQYAAAEVLSVYYPVTSFFITLSLSAVNFTINRLWVFRHD